MLYLKTGRLPYGPGSLVQTIITFHEYCVDMGTSAYVDLVSQNQVGDTGATHSTQIDTTQEGMIREINS